MKYDDIRPEKTELYGQYMVFAFIECVGSLIRDSYVASYLDDTDAKCYVLTSKEEPYLIRNKFLFSDFELEDGYLYQFNIPDHFIEDYLNFINGKWSKISDTCKKHLKMYAELPHFTKIKGSIQTHRLISLIEKCKDYKQLLELTINESVPDTSEFYGPPRKENFKTLDEFFEEKK
jgi:hypothetical protein